MKNRFNIKDLSMWFGIALLTIGVLALNYKYQFSSPVVVILWIVWLILSIALAYFTTQGAKALHFAADAKIELLKVVWPGRQETIQKTTIVMAMVVITSILLWGIDASLMWAIAKITHLG